MSRSKLPFHWPSDVISPNNGLELRNPPCDCCCLGLNATWGWLLVLVMVEVEPNELDELPNDVAGDLTGDLGCPGRLFCSFMTPPSFVGDRGLLTIALRCLSWLVLTARCGGGPTPGAPAWSNLFAIFFTDPAGREGTRCGVDFALLSVRFDCVPVPSCCLKGDLEADRAASPLFCGGASSFGEGVGVVRPAQ